MRNSLSKRIYEKELDDMKNDVDQKMDLIEYDLRSYRREREE